MLRRSLMKRILRHHTTSTFGHGLRIRFASSKTPTVTPANPPLSHPRRHGFLYRLLNNRNFTPGRLTLYTLSALLTSHIIFEYVGVFEGAWGISMLPTIASAGDFLLISKYYRRGRDLYVGDVVSFRHPVKQGEYAVKRIIGMEGDYVLLDKPGANGRMVQVPLGHCWVVGDNVTWSRDSRVFGPLPLALVTGKVLAKFSFTGGWERIRNGLVDAMVDE